VDAWEREEVGLPADEEDLADVGGSWRPSMGGVRLWPFVSKVSRYERAARGGCW
jgi:hypothetical protein